MLRGSWGKWTDLLTKRLLMGNIFMWGLILVVKIRRNREEAVRHFSLGKQGRA